MPSGIVHRDIKPSNLLLDHAGVVWIADFGLAKGEDEGLTHTGDIVGTLRYMAPCRFRGEGDARADIYALGLTLYELMTLRPAFETPDRLKLIEQIKNEEPARPRSLDGRIPRDLETIVLKAIEKDPEARYQSAQAMGEDLGRFLADEPIQARQVSAAERYWRWARRNPVIAVLGGVLTALLLATTLGSILAASYFRDLAGSESRANQKLQKAEQQAIVERDKSRQLSAGLTLEKGFALAQEGHADQGLLWMIEALKTAPDDAEEFRRTVRWNLGAWLGQVHKPLRIFDTAPGNASPSARTEARLPRAMFLADRSNATPIDLWETASGRKLSTIPGVFGPFAFRPDGQGPRRAPRTTGGAWWPSTWQRGGCSGRPRTYPESPGEERSASVPTDPRFLVRDRVDGKSYESVGLMRLDVVTGQQRGETMRGWGWIAVAPDGRTAATRRLENGEVYIDIYDLPSGRRKASWRAGRQGRHLAITL